VAVTAPKETNFDSTPKWESFAQIAKQVQMRVQFIPLNPWGGR